MLRRDYEGQVCSIARSLEVLGERWTLLIIREVFTGHRRFDEMRGRLGIARNVLSDRLDRLVENGILEKRAYSERPLRHEYRLTEQGIDLWPVIVALMAWGDRYLAGEAGPPVILRHRGDCGGRVDDRGICTACGERLTARQAVPTPGPGAPKAAA